MPSAKKKPDESAPDPKPGPERIVGDDGRLTPEAKEDLYRVVYREAMAESGASLRAALWLLDKDLPDVEEKPKRPTGRPPKDPIAEESGGSVFAELSARRTKAA